MTIDHAPSCQVLPEHRQGGPGWYLIAANRRVEVGGFPTREEAERVGAWMEDNGLGVNPLPWRARYSPRGLTIGTRIKKGVDGYPVEAVGSVLFT